MKECVRLLMNWKGMNVNVMEHIMDVTVKEIHAQIIHAEIMENALLPLMYSRITSAYVHHHTTEINVPINIAKIKFHAKMAADVHLRRCNPVTIVRVRKDIMEQTVFREN